ncbi:MAG: hypothetical protein ACXAC7_24060, partial [Candidatus Hodarchaeales archaeon]
IIGTERTLPVLTDLLVPNSYSTSYGLDNSLDPTVGIFSLSYATRQTVVYNAEGARRYIMLRGATPIQNITIACVAIYKDNTRNQIVLPPNSVFECKIGFYRR